MLGVMAALEVILAVSGKDFLASSLRILSIKVLFRSARYRSFKEVLRDVTKRFTKKRLKSLIS